MSNRDSLGYGELLPQDVVDIFAHEKHSKRGQKQRSRSLGRALGWLKGKKRKDLDAKGQNLGLGPALDLALEGHPAGHQGGHKGGQKSQAAPKRDNDDEAPPPPLFQENVFIEASRPKYLENIHTEALEGLKMMQQEETNNGVEFHDNESIISSVNVQTDGEGGGFVTDSTIGDTASVVSVQSSVSTRSSRSGLTRQGSTFRPLNSGKKSEKAKTRRKHRKPSAGIPQHVQRELGLDRVGWTVPQRLDEDQLCNGETDESPTTDGLQHTENLQMTANATPQDIKVIHPLSKEQLEQLAASNPDHMALLQRLGTDLTGEDRAWALAVPWVTAAGGSAQDPPSPVMTMSPQAAYMSKIIPNAVLPPSIDVLEISRGRSRASVRTVSKSSLVVSSPGSSRASSRASTRTTSTKISSASRYNPLSVSDSSCWSNSESTDTLVSDSSTISRNSTPKQKKVQDGDISAKEDKISVHSSNSKASKGTSNGKLKENKKDGFARSLSVMKSKRPPPPPNRSYSLHSKMKRRSRDLAEVRIIPGETSLHSISATGEENTKKQTGASPLSSRKIDSPGYHGDTSSLDDSPGSASFSPFRSQQPALITEGASTIVEEAQENQEPLKENKSSKVVSPSSGYSSQDGTSGQLSKESHSSSPKPKRGLFAKFQRLFPGSTHAAPTLAPVTQPEATTNTQSTKDVKLGTLVDTDGVSPSVRTLRELFNIPPHPKVHAPPPPPPEVWVHSRRSIELLLGPPVPDNIEAIIKKNPKDRRQQRQSPSASTERKQRMETKKVQESEVLNAEIHKENNGRLIEQNVDLKENSKVTEEVEKVKASDILSGMLMKAVERREERLVREEHAKSTEKKTVRSTLPAISSVRIPPSPSLPLVHHPPQPPDPSVRVVSPESSWPPPPPSVDQVGTNGPDEIDFPLPPPPMFGEEGLVLPVQVPPERSVLSVVTTNRVSVTTEAESQDPSTSRVVVQPPLNIPPPPSYSAPPPPVEAAYTPKKVSPLPPKKVFPLSQKDVYLPPIKEVSLPPPETIPPPPPTEVSTLHTKWIPHLQFKEDHPPPPPKEVLVQPKVVPPPPSTEVSPPPPKLAPLPPPDIVPPPPPKEVIVQPKVVPPPPPSEVSPPPTKLAPLPPPEIVPPPPPKEVLVQPRAVPSPPSIEVSLPPPNIAPLPPPEIVPPPPPKDISSSQLEKVSPPPPKMVSPPAPKEVSPPAPTEVPLSLPEIVSPPAPQVVSPLPPKEVSPPPSEEVNPSPPPMEVFLPPPEEALPPPPTEVSPPASIQFSAEKPKESSPPLTPPPLFKDAPSTLETVVSASDISTLSTEEVPPPSIDEERLVRKLTPPQSIPPPPPLLSEQEIDPPQQDTPSESKTNSVSSNSILTPPQSLPTLPPIQLLDQPQVVPPNTDSPVTKEESVPPLTEVTNPPALDKVQDEVVEQQPGTVSTENQTPEVTSATVVQKDVTATVTPTHQQTVELQSISSSPEPQKAEEKPEAQDTTRNQVPTSAASVEAPQKPIRKSLIMTSPIHTSPPSTSPPPIVVSTLPKSQSMVVPPTSSSMVLSPSKKSPPAMTASPSMNLQEAIRLRTAARSKDATSRLSLQSQTSPIDFRKSPTSTASFIFSKSNKKVVIDTHSPTEPKATVPKTLEVSSVTKVMSEAESVKNGVKVPPPVAKKPKSKGKEMEASEGTEQTAGQEALQETNNDATRKTNGTAGSVEGGGTPST